MRFCCHVEIRSTCADPDRCVHSPRTRLLLFQPGFDITGSGDPGTLVSEFTSEEVEVLARTEHRRWMADRLLGGWVLEPRDIRKRTSPYLVEWEDLPTHPVNVPDFDRNAVRILPEVLGRVGMEIRRS
jgi:hypothetical protein